MYVQIFVANPVYYIWSIVSSSFNSVQSIRSFRNPDIPFPSLPRLQQCNYDLDGFHTKMDLELSRGQLQEHNCREGEAIEHDYGGVHFCRVSTVPIKSKRILSIKHKDVF